MEIFTVNCISLTDFVVHMEMFRSLYYLFVIDIEINTLIVIEVKLHKN